MNLANVPEAHRLVAKPLDAWVKALLRVIQAVERFFEPDDQYKGDFARTYFYMATCYANKCSNWGNTFGSVSGLSQYGVDLFLKWHRQDPVSQKELDRNEAVYAKQKNRNPFIDCPELAEHIWGTKKNVAWYQGQSPVDNIELQQFEVFPNPAKDFLMIVAEM